MVKQELQEQQSMTGPSLTHYFPYRCLGEQVLVKRLEDEDEKTAGGVVKPDIARLKSNRGIIMALGEGRIIGDQIQPFNLQVGQFVRFSRVGGTDLEVNGETFILLHWKQVYLVETA